jgi:hypothetical protein
VIAATLLWAAEVVGRDPLRRARMHLHRISPLPIVICCLLAAGVASGCGSTVHNPSQSEGEAAARSEEANQKKEETAEDAQNRENLALIEAKTREEEAEASAGKTEAEASARAKRRLKAAEKAAKKKEKEAAEAVKHKHEAEAKAKTPTTTGTTPKPVTKPPTSKQTPSSAAPPQAVEVPSEPR